MDLTTQKLLMGSSEVLDPNTGITWSNVNYASLNNPDIWANNQMTKAVVTAGNSLVIGGDRAKLAIGGADAYADPFNVVNSFRALNLSENITFNALLECGAATHHYYKVITHAPNGTTGLTNITSQFPGVDDSLLTISLPFSVTFYGVAYTQITINTNGLIIFGSYTQTYAYPPDAHNICVFPADLMITSVYTGTVSGKFIVRVQGYNYPDQTQVPHIYEIHFINGGQPELHIVTAPFKETEFSQWTLRVLAHTSFDPFAVTGSVAGLACKFFNGSSGVINNDASGPSDWRATIAEGRIGTVPLTSTDNTVGASLPHGVQVYTSINYNYTSVSAANYGFIAIGYFKPPTTGTWYFRTTSDDSSGVWIGDLAPSGGQYRAAANAVVNNGLGTGHASQTVTGSVSLTGGVWYPIRIVHEEGNGGDGLTFEWSSDNVTWSTDLSQYFKVGNPANGGYDHANKYAQVGGCGIIDTRLGSSISFTDANVPIQFPILSSTSYRLFTVAAGTTFTPGTGTLYAKCQYQAYGATSTDGGYNWIRSDAYMPGDTTFFNGKKLLVFAQYGAGDYESTDAGVTSIQFAPKNPAWNNSLIEFNSSCFAAANENLLFAAGGVTSPGGYCAALSTNGGQTWRSVASALQSVGIESISTRTITGVAWNGTSFLVFFQDNATGGHRIARFNPTTQQFTSVDQPITATTGYGTTTQAEICAGLQHSYYDGTAIYRSGNSGILRSTNDLTWSRVQGGSGFYQTFKYNGVWVGIARSYGGYATSSDGSSWTQTNTSKSYDFDAGHLSGRDITASAYNGSQYIIGGATSRCSTSTDGMNWTNRSGLYTVAQGRAPYQFIWDGTRWFAALQYNNMAFSSDNGATWTAVDIYGQWGQDAILTIAYGNNTYVIGGPGGKISTSTTTGNAFATNAGWTARTGLQSTSWGTAQINKIIYNSSSAFFLATGNTGKIAGSTDGGVTWNIFTDATNWGTVSINDIVQVDSTTYVIVGDSGKVARLSIAYSVVLGWIVSSVWTVNSYIYTNLSTAPLTKLAYNGKRLITTSNTSGPYLTSGGKIFYSDDLGTTWTDAKLMDSGWFDNEYYGYNRAVYSLTVNNKKKFLITGSRGSMSHSPYEIADRPTLIRTDFYTTGGSFASQITSNNYNAANNNVIQKNDFVVIFVRYDDAGTAADLNVTRYNNGWLDRMSGTSPVRVSGRQGSRVFYSLIARTNGLEYFTATAGISVSNLEMRILVYRPGTNKLLSFDNAASGQAAFTDTVTTNNFNNLFQDGVVVNFISGYYGTGSIGTATYTVPTGTTKIGADSQFSSHSHVFRTARQINQTYTWITNNAYMGATSISLKQY